MTHEYGSLSAARAFARSVAGGAALVMLMLASAVPGTAAHAAALGKLTIVSGLDEPFRGEIDVRVSDPRELGSLAARLAPAAAYGEAGVQYTPVLESLKFTLARRPGGQPIIKVTSSQPFNEPVVDLLVELAWLKGRSTYGYTALIDPPAQKASRSYPERVLAAGAPSPQAAHATNSSPRPKVARSRDARPADAEAGLAKQVRVKEEQAVEQKHKLAAAHERIAELSQTVREQQQQLELAATAHMETELQTAAKEMRDPPDAAAMRASHEAGARQPATESRKPGPRVEAPKAAAAVPAEQGYADMLLGDPLYMTGGAGAVLLAAIMSMRIMRRRRGAADGELKRLAPTFQPAA